MKVASKIKPINGANFMIADAEDIAIGDSNVSQNLEAISTKINNIQKFSIIANILDFYEENSDNDYSDAFQKAFDYIALQYNSDDINENTSLISMLEIPSGRIYKITKTIYIKSPVLIKGLGSNGTVAIKGEWKDSKYYDMFEIRDTTRSARICFENIRFTSIPPTKSAIYAPSTFVENGENKSGFMVDGYIKSCWFESFVTDNSCGIRGTIADYLIDGNVFEHCNPCVDISIHDGQNRIVNNIMYQSFNGIKITGLSDKNAWQTKDTIIANNHFNFSPNKGQGGAFVNMSDYTNFTICNNTIVNNNDNLLDNAFILDNVKKGVISNNVISGVVLRGIRANKMENCIINANVFEKNSTINAVIAIELENSKNNNLTSNNISNFNSVTNSHAFLLNYSSDCNIITNNYVSDVFYGIRILGGKQNIINNNIIKAKNKYTIGSNNYFEKDNKGTTVLPSGDYTMTGEEAETLIFRLTSFSTVNFNIKGEFVGDCYNIATLNKSLQIFDGINNKSVGTLNANSIGKVVWDGSNWFVSYSYKS